MMMANYHDTKLYRYFEKRIKILAVLCAVVFLIAQLFARQHWFI